MTDTVFEFRNYTLHPGQRDVLIELFEREFTESQEALGIHVLGAFTNLDDPSRFVWMRGFADMDERAQALDAFYSGPVWQAHRTTANATMIDSDDVLQLRLVSGALPWDPSRRPPVGASALPPSLFVATAHFLAPRADEAFARAFEREATPVLRDLGIECVAALATDHRPNAFPRLPVRENETVFLSLIRFNSLADFEAQRAVAEASPAWRDAQLPLEEYCIARPQVLRLQPTARSLLR
jgi:hypothetical protein